MTAPRRKPREAQAPLPLTIGEGVHLSLPEAVYFAQSALGSSDFPVLERDPVSWWYGSPHNPNRRPAKARNQAQVFGSALHALMLEGEAAYARRFIVEPDPESTRYADSRKAMVQLLKDAGHHIPVRDTFDPAKLNIAIRTAGLAHRVRQTAMADYEAAKRAGRDTVSEDEDRRLRRMAHLIDSHADLGPNLKKGLTEVSVFWRDPAHPGALLRARFDKLLPAFTIDLKTFSNPRDESPADATLQAIMHWGYDIQAEHYRAARAKLAEFVAEGRVYAWRDGVGGKAERQQVLAAERQTLADIAAVTDWKWVWIFYQVQNDDAGREKGPVVVPWLTAPEGELFANARAAIDRALANYSEWSRVRGLAQPWAEIHPIRDLPIEKLQRLAQKRTTQ